MNDLERDLRELLDEKATGAGVPVPDPRLLRRARRRQLVTVSAMGLVAIVTVAGIALGIARLGTDRTIPAGPNPPEEAPVVIQRGSVQGWDWVFSASADGSCVALTDEQGSTTLCPTERESADIDGVTVRSPEPPGPNSVFVFGIVSPDTAEVEVPASTSSEVVGQPNASSRAGPLEPQALTPDSLTLHRAPSGVEGDRGFFLARFDGIAYPFLPDIMVSALGPGDHPWRDHVSVKRPTWARPQYTLLEKVASGSYMSGRQDWFLGLWRKNVDGSLCYPNPSGACGPPSNPVQAWRATWGRLGWDPLAVVDETFAWGVFFDPVVAVRVELAGQAPFQAETSPPPADYPEAPSVFVFSPGDSHDGRVVGLDADGNVVETELIHP